MQDNALRAAPLVEKQPGRLGDQVQSPGGCPDRLRPVHPGSRLRRPGRRGCLSGQSFPSRWRAVGRQYQSDDDRPGVGGHLHSREDQSHRDRTSHSEQAGCHDVLVLPPNDGGQVGAQGGPSRQVDENGEWLAGQVVGGDPQEVNGALVDPSDPSRAVQQYHRGRQIFEDHAEEVPVAVVWGPPREFVARCPQFLMRHPQFLGGRLELQECRGGGLVPTLAAVEHPPGPQFLQPDLESRDLAVEFLEGHPLSHHDPQAHNGLSARPAGRTLPARGRVVNIAAHPRRRHGCGGLR